MTCRPAIEYSLYTDGAMPSDELRAFELHLHACARCRDAD